MDKEGVVTFWRKFFTDLLVGTFKKIVFFVFAGFFLGIATAYALDHWFIVPAEWNQWAQWTVFLFAVIWYGIFGVFHGLAACAMAVVGKKLTEMVSGIHGLLDILTRGVIEQFPKFNKQISREELAEKFDQMGQSFLLNLRLKGGITRFLAGIIFRIVLISLKFFFLDDVVEELSKKETGDITNADIEHAVRRVGVEMVLSPITDSLILIHLINCVFLLMTFGLPFGIFLMF